MAEKITKRVVLEAIKKAAEAGAAFEGVTAEDVIAYVDTTIEQLNNKAIKAKERAAQKKVEGDALRDAVEAVLTDEFQTIAAIVAQVDEDAVTPAKVTARLTALVKAGLAHKTKVDAGDGRKVNGYAAGPAPETEDDAE